MEALYEAVGLPPAVAAQTSRVAVPVYKAGTDRPRHVHDVVTTLKKMIALATIDRPHFASALASRWK